MDFNEGKNCISDVEGVFGYVTKMKKIERIGVVSIWSSEEMRIFAGS